MKKLKKITALLLISLLSFVIFSKSNLKTKAEGEHLFEVYFTLAGSETFDKNELDTKSIAYGAGDRLVQFELMIKSNTGKEEPLSTLAFKISQNLVFNRIFRVTPASITVDDPFGGPPEITPIWYNQSITIEGEEMLFSIARNISGNYMIPVTGTKIADVALYYDMDNAPDNVNVDLEYHDIAHDNDIRYTRTESLLKPIIIGDPDSGPNAELESLSITGDSTDVYETSALPNIDELKEITISYQDSLLALNILATPKKTGLTPVISGAVAPYKDNDEIIITVTDDTDVKVYKRTIKVTPISTNNEVIIKTNKDSDVVSQGFDINGTDYNIVIPYSVTNIDILGSVDPLKLSTIDKASISVSHPVAGENKNIGSFIVTAENGVQKTYNVFLERELGDSNKNIDVKIKSVAVDKLIDTYSYELDEASSNFTVVITKEKATSKVYYYKGITSSILPSDYSLLPVNNQIFHSETILKGSSVEYTILVVSEDGSVERSILEVSRIESSNVSLGGVSVKENPTYTATPIIVDNETYTYVLKDNNSSNLEILIQGMSSEFQQIALLDKDSKDNTIIQVSSLLNGSNLYTIRVTAQNGDTKDYQLIIKKLSDEKLITNIELQDGSNFTSIVTGVSSFQLSGNTYTYTIDYDKADKIKLLVTTSLSSDVNKGGKNAIDFTYTFNGVGQLTYSSPKIEVKAENGTVADYYITIIRRAADTDNNLSGININGSGISGFTSNKTSGYDNIVLPHGTTTVDIEGFKISSKATIAYYANGILQTSNTIDLNGKTPVEIEIRVTAENLIVKTYKFKVLAASEENEITGITLSGIPANLFTFAKDKYTYTINVPSTISGTTVGATVSTYGTAFGVGDYLFTEGVAQKITVYGIGEAGNDSLIKYEITITRQPAKSYNNLESLTITPKNIDPINITLSSNPIFDYKFDRSVTDVLVNATILGSNGESIKGVVGNIYNATHTLKAGLNTISIEVKAENGDYKEYKITIVIADTINTFDKAEIENIEYTTDKFGVSKTLELPDLPFFTQEITFKLTKTNEFSVVTYGNVKYNDKTFKLALVDGDNILTFTIVSEDGSKTDTYTIKVKRLSANKINVLADFQVLVTYTDGTIDLLAGVDYLLVKTINLRVDRVIAKVELIAKVDKLDRSTIEGLDNLTDDGTNKVYTHNLELNPGGLITTLTFRVVAEDGITKNSYTVNVLRKNANNEINNVKVYNGLDMIYDGALADFDLGAFPFSVNKLKFVVDKTDEKSRLFVNGIENLTTGSLVTFEVDLTVGINKTIIIKVETEVTASEFAADFKSTSKIFTYTKNAASNIAELDSLEIFASSVDILEDLFNSTEYVYSDIRLDRLIKSVNIVASAKANGVITIGATGIKNLNAGNSRTFLITVTAEDGVTSVEYSVTIINKNDDSEVINITVDGNEIGFDKDTKDYVIAEELPYDTKVIDVIATLKDSFANVIISGNQALVFGENTIKVTATSDYGASVTIYTIKVTVKTPYENIDLGDLIVQDQNSDPLVFDTGVYVAGRYNFVITLPEFSTTTHITVIPTLLNGLKQNLLELDLVNRKLNDVAGKIDETITFTVTAENNATKTYSIRIVKDIKLSNDNTIKSVSLKDNFNPSSLISYLNTQQTYNITVDYKVDTLDLIVIANNINAVVNVTKASKLAIGINIITFQVQAENGDTGLLYTVNVIRKAASTDNFLKEINIVANGTNLLGLIDKSATQLYDPTTNTYTFSLDESYLDIMLYITKNHESQAVTGTYNQKVNLVHGTNTITLVVTPEDKDATKETYTIIINRVNSNITLTDLSVDDYNFVYNELTKTYHLGDVATDIKTININGTISDIYGKLIGTGVKTLAPGLNTFVITATAEDGVKTVSYTITINQVLSADNSIFEATLTDSIGTNYLVFDALITSYDITVKYNIDKLTLNIETNNNKAVITGAKTYNIGLNTVTVITFSVNAENGDTGQTYTINVTRNDASLDNSLSSLTLKDKDNNYLIGLAINNPLIVFDENLTHYDLQLNRSNTSVVLDYLANNTNAIITGDKGRKTLIGGETNRIEFTVTSENGDSENYSIFITIKNSEIEITSLSVDGYTINYTNTEEIYDLGIVEADVSTIKINATISDKFGSLVGTGVLRLFDGDNEFVVTATSEDGQKSVSYIIKVNRKSSIGGILSDDNRLFDILVEGTNEDYVLSFEEHILEYTINLKYNDGNVYLNPVTDIYAQVTSKGFHKVEAGANKVVYIKVTAQNGDVSDKTYKVTINRDLALTDNVLDDFYVLVNGEKIALDTEAKYQEITVTPDTIYVDFVTVGPNKATVHGDGIKVLETSGDVVTIIVTAQDGTYREYVVKVKKQSSDASLKSITITDPKTNIVIDYAPSFDPLTKKYNIDLTLMPNVNEINIAAEATTTVKSIDGLGSHLLDAGNMGTTDRFLIKVTAEDEVTIIIYEIIVKRNIDPIHSIIIQDLTLYGNTVLYLGMDKLKNPLQNYTYGELSYEISVPYLLESMTLSANSIDGATITNVGNYVLNNKTTIITFKIVSNSGLVESDLYTITITKEDPSSDNSLKDLTINGQSITGFDSTVYEYNIVVDVLKVSNINIGAIVNDASAKMSGDLGSKVIIAGPNSFTISVLAEDGSTQNYKINIDSFSFDNDLYSLEVLDYEITPEFVKDTLVYRVTVPYKTNFIEIFATAHAKANIVGTGIKVNLKVGVNSYTVYAVAENGNAGNRYVVEVTVLEGSNDTSLKNLEVTDKSGNILEFSNNFNPTTKDYIINIPADSNIMSAVVNATKNHAGQTVFGAGNQLLEGLVDGNYHTILKVTVEAENGDLESYTISVYRGITLDEIAEIEEIKIIGSNNIEYFITNNLVNDKFVYDIIVPFDVNNMTLTIKGVGKAYGTGIKNFNTDNEIIFNVYVVSQNGSNSSPTYTFNITREAPISNGLLSNLTIDGTQVPAFDPNVFNYTITRPNQSSDRILIDAVAQDKTTNITGIGYKDLINGINTFTINARSQDGKINSYTITINYVDSNALLENLIVRGSNKDKYDDNTAKDFTTFEFDPVTFEYFVTVDPNINFLRFTGAAQDQVGAKVTGFGTYEIGNEDEKIRIYVTSADGLETQVYTIVISKNYTPNNNSQLKIITIGGLNLPFDKTTYYYELKVDNKTNSVKLSAEAFNPNSKVYIDGHMVELAADQVSLSISNITAGKNTILIKVVAEDNITTSYYQVVINRDLEPDMLLTILLILSLLLWIITILVLVFKRNRSKDDDSNELIF